MHKLLPQIKPATSQALEAEMTASYDKTKPNNVSLTIKGKNNKMIAEAKPTATKNTRPLNSYMAFRSFYSKIFEGLQQKEISGYVTLIWQCEPFKGKWTLLAKAYSMIRDAKGKSATSLEIFLAINGPYIGVLAPATYFKTLGWEIVMGKGGGAVFRRNESIDLNSFGNITNISVDDIINNCYKHGFVKGDRSEIALSHTGPVMTMATKDQVFQSASTPPTKKLQDSYLNVIKSSSDKGKHTSKGTDGVLGNRGIVNGRYAMQSGEVIDTGIGSTKGNNAFPHVMVEASKHLTADSTTTSGNLVPPMSNLTVYTATTTAGQAPTSAGASAGGETGNPGRGRSESLDWDLHFIPGIDYDVFNPFGRDPFDPINISGDIGEDYSRNSGNQVHKSAVKDR